MAGADDILDRGRAASDANRFAEAYAGLLLPLADAGNPEAQAIVGSMMQCGLQWFDSLEQLHGGTGPVVDEATARGGRRTGRPVSPGSIRRGKSGRPHSTWPAWWSWVTGVALGSSGRRGRPCCTPGPTPRGSPHSVG